MTKWQLSGHDGSRSQQPTHPQEAVRLGPVQLVQLSYGAVAMGPHSLESVGDGHEVWREAEVVRRSSSRR